MNLQENRGSGPNFRQIQLQQFRRFLLTLKHFGIFHGRRPTRQVDDSYSPGIGEPVRNENLHRAITDLIVRSLSATLSDMHLADVR
jgi:hypothetical protein